ncbi:hypothetical protein REPUB_Repub08aG0121700 [Reevesia pubescens]
MLAAAHLSSCRQVTWASFQETQQNLRTKFSYSFTEHFSVTSSVSRNQKYSAVHGVSHQLVPGGPNPLHN